MLLQLFVRMIEPLLAPACRPPLPTTRLAKEKTKNCGTCAEPLHPLTDLHGAGEGFAWIFTQSLSACCPGPFLPTKRTLSALLIKIPVPLTENDTEFLLMCRDQQGIFGIN